MPRHFTYQCPEGHGLRKHVLDGAMQTPMRRDNYGKGHYRACPTALCRELCKYGSTDRFAICVMDRMGRRKHRFNRIRQVAPMCPHRRAHWYWRPHGRAHWRNLANTTEPSICGGDAALCQITLTSRYIRNGSKWRSGTKSDVYECFV